MPEAVLSQGSTHYEDEGEGFPIVLIHGMGLELGLWDQHVGRLSPEFRIIRLDTLGHGMSAAPAAPWGFKEHARQVGDLLRYLNVPKALIVGFSLGGTIGQTVALDYPDLVAGLMVVASVCDRTDDEQRAVEERLELVRADGPQAVASRTIDRWFTKPYQEEYPDVVQRWHRQILSNSRENYSNAYAVYCSTDAVLRHRLKDIRSPTRILTGNRDIGQNPRMAYRMGELIADSSVRILDGVAHMLPLEAESTLCEEIRSFARKLPGH